tara:strand:- start:356 stop:1174 length:819 start_codon:yes stop_codon:yes gene_type:complete
MRNLKMFCLSLNPSHYNFINNLGYTPVGLGEKDFSKEWFTDKSGDNISKKNRYYSECTFHYWLWKNYLNKLEDGWIGFCQYRKFWSLQSEKNENINLNNINNLILKEIPKEFQNYDSILAEPLLINQWKTMKFVKKGLKILIKKPFLIFNKNKRNINFHFDLMHGENNLKKAIQLLDEKNKKDFTNFVNERISFNPHVMVICKSKNLLKKYYEDLFPWLEKCEKLFGFEDLKGYGKVRMYGFLAERFMSYWFQKNTKSSTMPVIFFDINKYQ